MLFEAPGSWHAIALLGSLIYGYQLGVLNTPLQAVASDLGVPIATRGAAIVSALLAGGVFGALAAGNVADFTGPKRAILLADVVLALGCGLSFVPYGGIAALLQARFITGIASGCLSLLVPRYIVETAPPAVRGALASLSQLAICTGILVSYVAGIPYISSSSPTWIGALWWRWMLFFPAGLALVQAGLLVFCPESAIWLRWRGRHQQARAVVCRLSSAAVNDAEDAACLLLPNDEDDSSAAPAAAAQQVSWREIFSGRYTRMLVLGIGVPLAQQLSGVNTVIYFSSDIFASAGLNSPILGAVLVGMVNILGTVAATVVVDQWGRKPLMVISHSGMAASLFGITLASWLPGVPPGAAASVTFACVLLFVVAFSLGSGPLPFLYLSELLSSGIKGRVSSIATALNWAANLAVGMSFPVMIASLGIGGSYLIYGLINVACMLFCLLLMVETKRRPIHEIEDMLLHA